MPGEHVPLIAFNRGILSKLGLARIDIKRTANSAEVQENWMPRVLGSMMLRPGWAYLGPSRNNLLAYHVPFIFSTTELAILEFTDTTMRVLIDDEVVERPEVDTTITSGDFSSATGWTDADDAGATSTITGGKLELVGTKFVAAARKQQVTVAADDQGVEHGLRIVVDRGPITVRVGSTDGADDLISEATLGTGTHSLAFTPSGGSFWIKVSATAQAKRIVDSITIDAAGDLTLPTPFQESNLRRIRYDQSADVVYLACKGYQQRKVERRAERSWSVVLYEPKDGPFRNQNTGTINLTPSALVGDITLTASRSLFKSTHVGALFSLTSIGQVVTATVTGANQFTNHIKIVGVGAGQRSFVVTIGNVFTANVVLQRSVGEPGAWVDVATYTGVSTFSFNDALDNQTVYYRIGVKTGGYTSGTADLQLSYANGGLTGIVKITGFTNETTVSAAVESDLGSTNGSTDWSEGEWSDRRGYPSAVALHEGRLWFAGKSKIFASVSDAYESYDPDYEGDSAPINRSIGSGPVDNINWLVSLARLLIGTDGSEYSARSSALDEPLTKTNFNMKSPSTQGSAEVAAVKIDDGALFVQKSRKKVYKLSSNAQEVAYGYGDYASANMMELIPEIAQAGIVRLAVQRQPDTRVHCLLEDGSVAVLISQPAEEVLCWIMVRTAGSVEDVFVMPGVEEDQVYYLVNRSFGVTTRRYLEKWALESECQGAAMTKLADSHILYDDVPTNVIDSLGHLANNTVVIWGDGKDLGTKVVAPDGTVTLDEGVTVSKAVVGLKYEAWFKSSKLAYAAALGTALTIKKTVNWIGLILQNTHWQGLKFGDRMDLNYMDDLPQVEDEEPVAPDTIWEDLDTAGIPFPGEWDTDARLVLYAAAPRPVTVLAAVLGERTSG